MTPSSFLGLIVLILWLSDFPDEVAPLVRACGYAALACLIGALL